MKGDVIERIVEIDEVNPLGRKVVGIARENCEPESIALSVVFTQKVLAGGAVSFSAREYSLNTALHLSYSRVTRSRPE